jgi:hypothetical protein
MESGAREPADSPFGGSVAARVVRCPASVEGKHHQRVSRTSGESRVRRHYRGRVPQ